MSFFDNFFGSAPKEILILAQIESEERFRTSIGNSKKNQSLFLNILQDV
jgi:hypothetical protein